MPTRSEWNALAAKCEAATGLDREIDVLLAVAVGDVPAGYVRHDAFTWICKQKYGLPLTYSPATFTDSIDAIVSLIRRELSGWHWECGADKTAMVRDAADIWESSVKNDHVCWKAASPALALCTAFCRAKAETCEEAE
ncbi:MAG: hypothetical protein P4L79_10040 [Legionella sp.]|uniref:hypothetical protein n=1 Tax=Legionella sp. TaxID=459 RepID=UPI00283EE074|nr:hypothetical protein [Legionella sp.]